MLNIFVLLYLDSQFECWVPLTTDGSFMAGRDIAVTCNVSYHGNLQPQMKWVNPQNPTPTSTGMSGSVLAIPEFNGDIFQTQMFFPPQTKPQDTSVPVYILDEHTITYQSIWNSSIIDILCELNSL